MKISAKGWLATTTGLGTIALLAVMIWWANGEVEAADQQRRRMSDVARVLNDLRLVTFEYVLYRNQRAYEQERRVAERLERALDAPIFSEPEPSEILADLRRRSTETRQLFEELQANSNQRAVDENTQKLYEELISRKLLVLHQESLVDTFRLLDFSNARIAWAQHRVVVVIVVGLALIALATVAAGWLIHRGVLVPIQRLQQATREVASGNWAFRLDIGGHDEIGEMSRNFDAMTTTLRNSFAQIERSNQELAALNHEIESFSYSVSHDLRAPLRSMDGFSLALLEDYGDRLDDEGREHLSRIRAASQRMGRLIDELLGLSRVTRTELVLRNVDLGAIARDIANSMQKMHPERAMRWEIDEGLIVHADKSLMQIAMQNLLENAWKFTSKTADAVIRVGSTVKDGRPVCFVGDNGVGFDMTYADRLFGAFQRLHHETEFPGTGIGLAIVHRILRRHDGSIWAEARPGQGATFYFHLPGVPR